MNMPKLRCVTRSSLALSLAFAAALPAQALGTFDVNTEGWTVSGNSSAPAWNAGGYIDMLDADNGWAYFKAPAPYLNPVALGGSFAFDLKHSPPSSNYPFLYNVRVALQGSGFTLISESTAPTTDWKRYSFDLNAVGGWRLHSNLDQNYNPANTTPTDAQFSSILSNLTGVFISADYTNGTALVGVQEVTSIDNISLVPEPGTWALMAAGMLGVAAAARRRQHPGA